MDSVGWSKIEVVARLHVEGGVPGIEVADGVGAVLAGGVGVGEDLLADGGCPGLAGLALGVAEEELLVAGEAANDWGWLAVERGLPCVVGCSDAGEVGDVFAERLVAVEVQVGEGRVGVVLFGEIGR